MEKIPVGATLAQAFRFCVNQFFPVLGLTWLPWALGVAGNLLMEQIKPYDSTPLALFCSFALSLLLMAMQAVNVTQLALGLRDGRSLIHLDFGPAVRRMLGALALVSVIVGILLVGAITGGSAIGLAKQPPQISFTLAGLVGLVLAYFLIRLSFFLAPIAVAEGKIGLFRSWELGSGNFWRQLAISLTLLIPLLIAIAALNALVLFTGAAAHGSVPSDTPIALILRGRQTQNWYIAYPLSLLASTLFLGATFGAQGFAYRALVPEEFEADAFS